MVSRPKIGARCTYDRLFLNETKRGLIHLLAAKETQRYSIITGSPKTSLKPGRKVSLFYHFF